MEFLEIIKVVFLGIVQGITEWLPISSTGHMILVDAFLKLNVTDSFKEMFLVVIQFGSILAVLVLFFHKLNPFSPKKSYDEKKSTFMLWAKVIVGIIPAGVIGILFDDDLDRIFYNPQTVAATLIIYGILFIIIENINKNKKFKINDTNELTFKTAFLIGAFQVLALIPGTSRSGATIIGAMLIGTSRYVAAEYSFFLAVPVMFGASAIKMLKFGFNYQPMEIVYLLIGVIVAFLVSLWAIKFLMGYIKKHDFKAFGYYRIILGLIVLALFFINII